MFRRFDLSLFVLSFKSIYLNTHTKTRYAAIEVDHDLTLSEDLETTRGGAGPGRSQDAKLADGVPT